MTYTSVFLASWFMFCNIVIFDFNTESDLTDWRVVDDVVMGGRSQGHIKLSDEGHLVFSGNVSLENNGGFSSMRYQFDEIKSIGCSTMLVRLKGDGKGYQFRVKTDSYDRHSYTYNFQTSGEWQIIEIPLEEMKPSFRGMTLNIPNFDAISMEEIGILIANNRNEAFQLEIDKITLGDAKSD